jgi:transposase InsO family protein
VIDFMEDHHDDYGIEPMCEVLRIAPSTWYTHKAEKANPRRRSNRAKADDVTNFKIRQVFEDNFGVYGVRKVWHQLNRQRENVGRDAVAPLMKAMGLQGIIRGKPVRTTIQDKKQSCPLDHVNRIFKAERPDRLWVSDFTYVRTWQGFVYVAFAIDVFLRIMIGWKAGTTEHAEFVLDALDQALYARRPAKDKLIHHSDRGSQYFSIKYTEKRTPTPSTACIGGVKLVKD